MTEDFLDKLGWEVTWNENIRKLDNLLLWLPIETKYTLITSVNNYSNTLFKGYIESNQELEFITNLLTKKR